MGGELDAGEPHPAAYEALKWLEELPPEDLFMWMEAFASCALSGNRLAEICSETLRRVTSNEPVSDRYLLGLVLSMQLEYRKPVTMTGQGTQDISEPCGNCGGVSKFTEDETHWKIYCATSCLMMMMLPKDKYTQEESLLAWKHKMESMREAK